MGHGLATAPPDPNHLAVYLDKVLIPRNALNGWSFGASSSSILVTGSTCDRVTSGVTSTVQAYFGCPDALPPPFLP